MSPLYHEFIPTHRYLHYRPSSRLIDNGRKNEFQKMAGFLIII